MWMGKLYEIVNDKPKAIHHYERLVFYVLGSGMISL